VSFNLATILRESAATHPSRALCHAGKRTLTYREVDEVSGRICRSLLGLGLTRGDRVAVQLPNVPEFVLLYFGILKAGLIVVPLNPLLTAREVEHQLRDSGATVLVASEDCADAACAAAEAAGQVTTFVVGRTSAAPSARDFAELCHGDSSTELAPVEPQDTAVIIYTSGTTGAPKGAELTHFQLFMNCTVAGAMVEFCPDDVAVALVPMFHVYGLSNVLNIAVRYGGSLALMRRYSAHGVLETVEAHGCTFLPAVPTILIDLVEQLEDPTTCAQLASLRVVNSGGAALPGEVIRRLRGQLPGCQFLEGYGLTESGGGAISNAGTEPRVLSIGKPIWGVEVRVADDDGAELPAGPDSIGELLLRGHLVMKGYFNNPAATSETIRDGWLHTGDLGYVDEDGYFYVVDRKKDLIIRGGYNVYPREVEEVLYLHPAIAQAAVIGMPHATLGEEVVAVISTVPGASVDAEAVIAFCKEHLAAYKYPREVVILDSLPVGGTGKILKAALRERFRVPAAAGQRPT
jgi:long-chain acyl-CoA synthetase